MDISQETTVEFVARKRLCTSCGTCAGVCGNHAIEMRLNRFGVYVPVIEKELCIHCGLCVRVCPGYGFDYHKQYRRIHGSLPGHVALGACLGCYAGYTKDREVLHHSQSGGFVSTLALFCMEKGLADGTIVTRWRQDSPLEPETYIARSREEVLAAVGSKYNPVPASQIIRAVLKESGRFVFVGTSCQIHGMRKAEEIFPELPEKIVLYVGLHCLGVFTYHFHEQILHKIGLKRSELAYFRHRDKASGGWPCGMRLKSFEGKVFDLDADNSRLWPRPYFTNWRCLLCFDKANEFSDVSCGDCRIPDEYKYFEKAGYNLRDGLSEFVIRTARAQEVVSKMIEDGQFVVHKTDADSIASSIGVAGKKLGLNTFSTIARLFRLGVPEYGVQFMPLKIEESCKAKLRKLWTIVSSSKYYLAFIMGRYATGRWVLKRIPHIILGKLDAKCRKRVEWCELTRTPRLNALTDKNQPAISQKDASQ